MKQKKQRPGNTTFMLFTIALITLMVLLTGAKIESDASEKSLFSPDVLRVTLPVAGRTAAFVSDTLCNISDNYQLNHFFAELEALKRGKDTVINIIQLGDSHIQAGYFSGQLMRSFHKDFGNAGRGFISPLKLIKSNEPDDYFIRSTIPNWTGSRCIQSKPLFPFGIGGMGIKSTASKINMDVEITPVNGAGYLFNEAVLFRHSDALPLIATGLPVDMVKTMSGKETLANQVVCDTFRVGQLTDKLLLRSHTHQLHGNNIYYGLNLTNKQPGVLFHSIGINGAMFINYTSPEYVQQLALLKPSLLIISLGTNETFGRRFTEQEFTGQLSAFISLVRKYIPSTAILLTTPPECYKRIRVNKKRVYVRNENIEKAAHAFVTYAHKEGIPCWDLFAVTGGKGSYKKWYSAGLMGNDRVHFTKEAYREQGKLLYRALMKSYNQYITASQNNLSYVQPDSTLTYVY